MKPWCVFYGTRVALVFAPTKKQAFVAFIEKMFPHHDAKNHGGHYARPTADEVNIRPLRKSDEGWIDEFPASDAAPFMQALKQVAR